MKHTVETNHWQGNFHNDFGVLGKLPRLRWWDIANLIAANLGFAESVYSIPPRAKHN